MNELTQIDVERGFDEPLARQVSTQLMERVALGAYLRDELGITEQMLARPTQAALASAMSFGVGAGLPLIVAMFSPEKWIVLTVGIATLLCLIVLGGLSFDSISLFEAPVTHDSTNPETSAAPLTSNS